MKNVFFLILVLLHFELYGQEQFLTSHFNWSPKTKTIQKVIYSFNEETNEKEWNRTETYFFYHTFLDSIVVDLGDAEEITKCNYTIDNNLISKITDYKLSETQDKTLLYYNKENRLVKSKEFLQGRLFSETKYTYDKKNRLLKSVGKEKETGINEITEYSNYISDDSYTKTTYYLQGKKKENVSVEIYENGLLIEGNYQTFDLKCKVMYQYDKKRNIIYERKDNEAPTLYQYEYDAEGNPTKISISNAGNSFLNSEITIKSIYSDFMTN